MGRLKRKGTKNFLSGKAGNVEFFVIGEEQYFRSHAKRHKKSRSKAAVGGRNNFKSVVKLAQTVISNPVLKEIWNRASLEGRNSYQKIIKYNMPLAYDGNLTIKNLLLPKGRDLYIEDFPLEDGKLNFSFDLYGKIKPPLDVHLLYYFYNYKFYDKFYFEIEVDKVKISPDEITKYRKNGESRYTIKMKIREYIKGKLEDFKDVVVLIAITGAPTIANRKGWTNTVGFDIPLI